MSPPETGGRVHHHEVVIVGSGFAGLGQARELRRAGIDDVVILEKADGVGGTWGDNTYPRRQVHHGQEMTAAAWDEEARTWTVRTAGGDVWVARFLISGVGGLHIPNVPTLPGAAAFTGPSFPWARWDHDVDLRGKRVAVIGTGASALRFLPQIAPEAASVQLYQRIPVWVLPTNDRPLSARRRNAFTRHPRLHRAYRAVLFTALEWRAVGVNDAALARENVDVITSGVGEVRGSSIVDGEGVERGADVIIYGTGFEATDAFDHLDVTGRGRSLRDVWGAGGMITHRGITVSDFPNLFFLLGPNTALGHNSVVFMIECQTRYVAQAITAVRAAGLSGLDVRAEAQQRSNAAVQKRLARGIRTRGGCTSRHLDAAGVDRTICLGFTVRYWWQTRRFDAESFELFGRAADTARPDPPVTSGAVTDQPLLHDGSDQHAVTAVQPPAGEAPATAGAR